MLTARRAWLLAALFLAASAITAHATQTAATLPSGAILPTRLEKSLRVLEKVRLYAFSGLGDDVKQEDWPKLRPGWQVNSAVILLFLGACICSAGGVGGGGLFIPIFNLLLRFDAKTSAELSNFVIFGGSLANLIWNLPQPHPLLPHKRVIDYDVALLLQPNMLLGISIGVICNVMFPTWLITAQLAVILGYITYRSSKTGLKRWKVESELASAREASLSGDGVERGEEGDVKKTLIASLKADEAEAAVEEPVGFGFPNATKSSEDLLTPLLAPTKDLSEVSEEADVCTWIKVICLGLVWLAFFTIQLLRGSRATEGIFPLASCGLGYWMLTSSQVPLTCLVTVCTALRHPKRCSCEAREAGVVTRSRALTLFPRMALAAGVLGGMLGIGGGMIMNPLLLETGMHPQVTAATTAFMVFFSSSLSVVEFWLLGRIPMDFAIFFSVLCFLASMVGLVAVHYAISRYGRASIIVFSVSTVMGISAVMMAGFGGLDIYRQYQDGRYMGFHTPCG